MGVQQKLMRHAQIATTMNVYGDTMMESKRTANSRVVERYFGRASRGQMKKIAEAAGFAPFCPCGKKQALLVTL
jgi:hypothetical protein